MGNRNSPRRQDHGRKKAQLASWAFLQAEALPQLPNGSGTYHMLSRSAEEEIL